MDIKTRLAPAVEQTGRRTESRSEMTCGGVLTIRAIALTIDSTGVAT